jgi:nitrogen fixation negative regulator NifL
MPILGCMTTEQRLAEDTMFLAAAFRATGSAVLITDAEGHITWANPAFTKLTGFTSEEIIGKRPSILKSGAHDAAFYQRLWSTIRSGATWRGQMLNRRKDGSRYTEEQTITPVTNETGEIRGYVAVKQDVSEREQLAMALKHRESRYQALLENMLDVIYVVDTHFRIVYVSPSVERVFGYRPQDRVGRSTFELIHPDDIPHVSGLLAAGSRRSGFAGSAQYRIRHSDGSWRWVEAIGSNRFDDPIVAGAVITVRDITQRREAEDLQTKLRGQLAQSEKLAALGELLSGVAHELNNPLSVVIGYATLLQKTDDAAVRARAEKISGAAARCGRIVKNFLAVARQHPPERQRLCVNPLVREAVELVAYPLRVDSVNVELDLADGHPTLSADPHQLHQVLVNLLTNAYHAVRTIPTRRQITIATRLVPAREQIEIEVTDNGPGIPPDVEARIFEPFFTTKPVGQGTGLGLPICKGIVEAHGGTLEVEGRPGVGARFRVLLPVGTASSEPRPETSAGASQGHGEHVLVVDDEPDVTHLLAAVLTRVGYTVETAPNGRVALEKLDQHDFHAVLSDIKMPDLDGPGLYRAIAERRPELLPRLAFLTGDTLGAATSTFVEKVGVPRLMKPFALEDVEQLVARLVAGERTH